MLLGLWRCGQRACVVHHIHRPPGRVGFRRRLAVKRRVRACGVVELDPLADDALDHEAVGHLVQVDGLVFQRPPETLDEDVVQRSEEHTSELQSH